ncbi:hypothetical protein [Teredinibacter purpureus]|uniref:hypothetical protein n=1 Tax=Teredinibacter purpureus TaxID=2731756 RepID=UPI0005F77F46|nr:hypothetical protein [Teredinibacter purpureus]
MLTKRSRYYKLADTTFPDRKGVRRRCKAVRRLKPLIGRFSHTLDAADRLDHLAYKYYRQSLYWWRICDANPQLKAPLALLDQTALKQIAFHLTTEQRPPPLAVLHQRLTSLVGVTSIEKTTPNGLTETVLNAGPPIGLIANTLLLDLDDAVLSQQVPASIELALQLIGVTLIGDYKITKPEPALWQFNSETSEPVLQCQYRSETAQISVNTARWVYHVRLHVTFNEHTVAAETVMEAIATLGFNIAEKTILTNVGQSITIPPRNTGGA